MSGKCEICGIRSWPITSTRRRPDARALLSLSCSGAISIIVLLVKNKASSAGAGKSKILMK